MMIKPTIRIVILFVSILLLVVVYTYHFPPLFADNNNNNNNNCFAPSSALSPAISALSSSISSSSSPSSLSSSSSSNNNNNNNNNHNNNILPSNYLPPEPYKSFTVTPSSCIPSSDSQSRFNRIAENGIWSGQSIPPSPDHYYTMGNIDNLRRRSVSGQGSEIGPNTINSLAFLDKIIAQYNIKTFIDAPCGDVNWQFQSWRMDSLSAYIGLDISNLVINLNKKRFAFHSNKLFVHWDVADCPLPKIVYLPDMNNNNNNNNNGDNNNNNNNNLPSSPIPADAIHMRDVFQHLTQERALSILNNIRSSGIKYFIATTYPSNINQHITESDWYTNNLFIAPFNMPQALECIDTHPAHEADRTCIWKIN